GSSSPQINAFLAATGWNLKKMIRQLKVENEKIFFALYKLFFRLLFPKIIKSW
ncbi:MAG: hypothetical protein ACI9UJ_002036, partial [bacterium]